MRTKEEIEEVHKFLTAILRASEKENIQLGDQGVEDRIVAAANAICWVMGCPGGDIFFKNYQAIRTELEKAGFKMMEYQSHAE